MKKKICFLILSTLFLAAFSVTAQDSLITKKNQPKGVKNPVVIMQTNMGTIEIALNSEKAPETVKNFLSYVNDGFYNGTIFHRVIPGFMIQGGGFQTNMGEKEPKAPIINEATNGLSNKRGTISMARRNAPNSASCQFFINLVDNDMLDHQDNSAQGFGYAVFGEVVSGMDVVDSIAKVKTGNRGSFENVPVETVIITSVTVKNPDSK